jgi:hypothetical protein
MREARLFPLGALIGAIVLLSSCNGESPTTSLPEGPGTRGAALQAISTTITEPLNDGDPEHLQCKTLLDTAIAIVNAATPAEFKLSLTSKFTSLLRGIISACDTDNVASLSDRTLGMANYILGREVDRQIAASPVGDVAACTTDTAAGAVGDRLLGCFLELASFFGTGLGVVTPAGGGGASITDAEITFPPGFVTKPAVISIQPVSCAGFPSGGGEGEVCAAVGPPLSSANFDPQQGCTQSTCAAVCVEAGAGRTIANTALGTFIPSTTTLEILLPSFECTPPGAVVESKIPQGGLRLANPGGIGGLSPHASPFFPVSVPSD